MIAALVTDRRRLAPSASTDVQIRCLVQQAQHATAAGIDLIQVREPDLPGGVLASLVAAIVDLTRGTRTRVVVNDRLDVASVAGADGVHLRGDSFDWRAVRRLMPPPFVIGCSVHGVVEAESASGADYLIAGTLWSTASKAAGQPLLGVEGLSRIVAATRVPVLAIGGVTADCIGEVAATGAAGIAAIGLFTSHASRSICRAMPLGELLHSMRAEFDTSRSGS
jgi:thiamine-phosphate pyrophosphorylase